MVSKYEAYLQRLRNRSREGEIGTKIKGNYVGLSLRPRARLRTYILTSSKLRIQAHIPFRFQHSHSREILRPTALMNSQCAAAGRGFVDMSAAIPFQMCRNVGDIALLLLTMSSRMKRNDLFATRMVSGNG